LGRVVVILTVVELLGWVVLVDVCSLAVDDAGKLISAVLDTPDPISIS
jgi:hypothetical protein